MNFNENNILYENELSNDLRISKFKTSRENFPEYHPLEFDYASYLKRSSFMNNLPEGNSKELLINFESGYLLLLCNLAEFAEAEQWISKDSKNRLKVNEELRTVKDFFQKWAVCNNIDQRKYFGLSTIRSVEKSSVKSNFLNNIYHALILTYDQTLFAPDIALDLLEKAKIAISSSSMSTELLDGLSYYIQIYKGFCFLKKYFYEEALKEFLEALRFKTQGLNARYYLLYTYKKKKETAACLDLMKDVIENDYNLLKSSVDLLNPAMLEFMINNASLYHILNDNEFSFLIEDMEKVFLDKFGDKKYSFQQLNEMIRKLAMLNLKEYYNEEAAATIKFIEEICEFYNEDRNIFLNAVSDFLLEKVHRIIALILEQINKKNEQNISERLQPYAANLLLKEEELVYLQKDMEDLKRSMKNRMDESLSNMEKNIKEMLASLELRIESLQNEKKYNPRSTFNSSMVYNFIITLVVFTISGFSGCYNGTIQDVYSFADVSLIILLSGLKWGSVTFLIGIIISMFASGYTIVEKLNEKQNLLNKIQFWKKQLEKDTQIIKDDYENKLKRTNLSYSEKMENKKESIKELIEEKKNVQERLTAEFQEKLASQSELLNSILEN